jgi:transposase
VQAWLVKHPRFNMHFTPTSASWLNMVERFFRDITVNRLRRGVFTSVPQLVTAIDEYVAHHNIKPKPFIWTKSAADILQKVIRANSRLGSKQNATLH